MGVCCIIFDIDRMLFEFLYEFFKYSHFMFTLRFMIFPTFFEKNYGGGGQNKIGGTILPWGCAVLFLGGLRVTNPTIRLVCPSVRPSVRPSVCLSVCPSTFRL